ncbi:Rho GTPase activation protein [Cokeromyces recurvatus]|uniref:Rho GTPase activation protein n=1 Tax=Cokeromyces recurvatus TaxID=90255 RepID=UPI002220DA7E|nr:Rho GTPase activation protein [Cokeromyces recurvatus]KAI7899360.1 Rho GTPase activation protein [Cokeromyces recurvatus]
MRGLSDTDSESSMSSAFSSSSCELNENRNLNNISSNFAKLVRDTRFKVEQKTSEINATMQEKLPEWKQRGAIYSNKAKETGIEWSRKGKEAVDRWKKERADESRNSILRQQQKLGIFGMPLEVAVALTKIEIEDLVPAVFRRCIEYLNDVGVHEVGIYRIPGSTTTVNKLRAIFNDGSDVDFYITKPDTHAVGTLLKMYLRELPEPIIPYELANEYTQQFLNSIQTANDSDKKAMEATLTTSLSTMETGKLPPISPELLRTVRHITSRLPINNFCLLQLLCQHLKRVTDYEQENRMSISNLAVIFIPTLNIGRALFHCLVEHYHDIFETNKSRIPPPLPQKPRKLYTITDRFSASSIPTLSPSSSSLTKKTLHSKTMSDTVILENKPLTTNKVPPPKPSRSPSSKKQVRAPLPLPSKPRSKSVSSPIHNEEDIWIQTGRVEAIGRQFEILMNKKE